MVPFPDEDGIDVTVGMQSNIAIERTFFYRQSSPYSNCIGSLSDSDAKKNEYLQEMYNQIEQGIIAQYMQKYCLKLCFQYYIMDKCKCKSLKFSYLNISKSAQGCVAPADIDCAKSNENIFYETDQVNSCYESCPIECNTVTYNLNTMFANYPSLWYAERFNEYKDYFNLDDFYKEALTGSSGITEGLISETTAMINVFYSAMQYDVLNESPIMTFELLLANIGGNLGKFLQNFRFIHMFS